MTNGSSGFPKRRRRKGKGKQRSLCARFQNSRCPNTEETCNYRHIIAQDAAEKERLAAILEVSSQRRSRTPSPAGDKAICRQFAETGSCTFGASCRYSHETAMPAPKAKGKGRGKKPKGDF